MRGWIAFWHQRSVPRYYFPVIAPFPASNAALSSGGANECRASDENVAAPIASLSICLDAPVPSFPRNTG
jgi:hypothetical protein